MTAPDATTTRLPRSEAHGLDAAIEEPDRRGLGALAVRRSGSVRATRSGSWVSDRVDPMDMEVAAWTA